MTEPTQRTCIECGSLFTPWRGQTVMVCSSSCFGRNENDEAYSDGEEAVERGEEEENE